MCSLPGSWLAVCMADLTLDLHTSLSRGSTLLRFRTHNSLSLSVFHDTLGRPGPHFPSTCMLQALLIATLERSTCPNQRSIYSLSIMLRSSISSCASSLLYPPQTVFVGGYTVFTLSVRPNQRTNESVSVTFCFLNIYTPPQKCVRNVLFP